jgi:site-specific DNA-methyltransferase (adenine-specific)
MLRHGDFRDWVAELENGSVDCLLTDPPYGIQYESHYRRHEPIVGDVFDESLSILEAMCALYRPKLKPDAHIYIFTSWRVMHAVVPLVSRYFYVKNCLVWDKRVHGCGDLKRDYAHQHEFVLYCWMDSQSGRALRPPRPSNVLPFMRVTPSQKVHPTEKPVGLLLYLLEKSVSPGDLVADPFAGSGTTLLAARELGCRWWGCEIDADYYRCAEQRLRSSAQTSIVDAFWGDEPNG